MRPIHIASLDKRRPVLVLTREAVRPYMTNVTVAPITSSIRGLSTEVRVGTGNGLSGESVINVDNVQTIPSANLGPQIGWLLPEQEAGLAAAITVAFDLHPAD